MHADEKDKKYYSIGEVSDLLNVKEYTIRYWEQMFSVLAPQRNEKSGRRVYGIDEIKILQKIKKMLYNDGYTIKGAIQELEKEKKEPRNIVKNEENLKLKEMSPIEKSVSHSNLDSIASKKQMEESFYRKINKEILSRLHKEISDLLNFWEHFSVEDE
ncbi:MAG TPA: hypothetical protein DHW82_12270 [Spirochaetia bacterium]|nr:MAG: hypothetical protein A2Y41_02880 [Spirochaetes bacterium GWB1_36_13]HCL57766.1 hypothetical protein [Spirochaetia bacterium]